MYDSANMDLLEMDSQARQQKSDQNMLDSGANKKQAVVQNSSLLSSAMGEKLGQQ